MNLRLATTLGLFLLILYTWKIFETCVSMAFPDFQRQVEWCQSYFRKMYLKAYI